MELGKIEGSDLGKNVSSYSIPMSASKATTKRKITTLKGFLDSHKAKDGDEITHTRIGDHKSKIYGGKYNIPDEELEEFFALYKKDIVDKKGKEYLTERQLDQGPIAIDLDFHYDYEVDERQHTNEHIEEMVLNVCEHLKSMFCFDDESFKVFIFEKPDVNRVADKKITKDGIHIIINLSVDKTVSKYLRECMLRDFPDILAELPVNNVDGWEGVVDNSVMSRSTGWQVYGSRKPNHKAYQITHIFEMKFDEDDGEFQCETLNVNEYSKNIDLMEISVRNKNCQKLTFKTAFIPQYEQLLKSSAPQALDVSPRNNAIQAIACMTSFSFSTYDLIKINTKDELDRLYNNYLLYVESQGTFSELRDIIPLTLALPGTYYENGSYEKWFRVGCALKNSCPDDNRNLLLPLWLKFSSQSSTFNYNSIPELVQNWDRNSVKENGKFLTYKSIAYWVKQDNHASYKEICNNSIYKQLYKVVNETLEDPNGMCGEAELTKLLYILKGEQFVCAAFSGNGLWYQIVNGRYIENDCGVSLRNYIMTGFRTLISGEIHKKMNAGGANISISSKETKKTELGTLKNIYTKLGREPDAKKIMSTAKHLFYEQNLGSKLDSNPELLCFNNGVYDFHEGCFREPRPDDYLSKCTNINYIELTDLHTPIVHEIETFLHQLFPEPELYDYMFDFLACTLNGTSNGKNQKFNMWIGDGANGKSVLITLMEAVLGDYKVDVPTSLITEKRARVGQHSGELLDTKGARLAVINEPTKGEKINEGVMKQLTSNTDKVTARAMYKEHETFVPQCCWVLASNVLMEVGSNDHGTWRRIDAVPFKSLFTANPVKNDPLKPYQFPIDPEIINKFDSWKEVFASMLIKRVMQTKGIVKECKIVRESSDKYKQKQDAFSQFVAEKIIVEEGGKITKSELTTSYRIWHEQNIGTRAPPGRELFENLDKLHSRKPSETKWMNIRLKYDNDDDDPDDDC
jgi:P4 family phage/plasmid primase-like protien